MKCIACNNVLGEEAACCPKCGARQPHGPTYDQYTYAAFISYRHRSPDKETAVKLHRALEGYRLPKSVAQTYGSRKVGRVFRDQDELRATESLPQAIRDALKKSRSLIVVCSPATPESEWVNQEIEAFASYHGRERIIAVLAEGSSAESLPDLLKTKTVPFAESSRQREDTDTSAPTENVEGECTEAASTEGEDAQKPAAETHEALASAIPPEDAPKSTENANRKSETAAQPLAADMRESAKRDFGKEKLRVIAAITDCDFDDLARRDRGRKQRISAASFAFAACIIALLAIFGFGMHSAQRDANLSEAERLATLSLELSEQGRIREAQYNALAAADAAKRAGGWELVPKVHHALEVASTVYPSGDTLWTPVDSRVSPGAADTIAINGDASCYAIVDANLNAVVYVVLSEKPLWSFPLPHDEGRSDTNPANWKLLFHGPYLLAYNPNTNGSGKLACFNYRTGETVLDTLAYADAVCFAKNSMIGFFSNVNPTYNQIVIGYCDLEKGKANFACPPFDLEDDVSQAPYILGCAESDTRAAFALDSLIATAEIGQDKANTTHAAKPFVSSLKWCNETLIVASYDIEQQPNQARFDYVIEGFSPTLEKRWETTGTYYIGLEGTIRSPALPNVTPQIALGTPDAKSVYVSAGQTIYNVKTDDGSATEAYQASHPICELGDMITTDDMFVAHALDVNGAINLLIATSPDSFRCVPDYMLQLPERCRTAKLGYSQYFNVLATAISDSDEGRIHFRRTSFGNKLPWDWMQTMEDDAIGEGYRLFSHLAGGSRVLGAQGDKADMACTIFDSETLEAKGSVNFNEIARANGNENPIYAVYSAKAFPDMRYFFPESDDDSSSTLYAYDLAGETVTGTLDLTLFSDDSPESNADYPQFVSYATQYGAAILRTTSISQGKVLGLKITTVDPRTLETRKELEMSTETVPLSIWPLAERMLIAYAGQNGIDNARGQIGLFDSATGQHIESDLDSHKPYSLESGETNAMAVNASASQVAVACDDDMLRCYSLPTGTCAWELPFNGRAARFLLFEYAGNRLFAQDANGICYSIDANTGKAMGQTDEALEKVESGRFSEHGERFFASYRESDDSLTSMYVLENIGGRIGMVSDLSWVPFVSTNESLLVKYINPKKATITNYYSTDTLYDFAKQQAEYAIDEPAKYLKPIPDDEAKPSGASEESDASETRGDTGISTASEASQGKMTGAKGKVKTVDR